MRSPFCLSKEISICCFPSFLIPLIGISEETRTTLEQNWSHMHNYPNTCLRYLSDKVHKDVMNTVRGNVVQCPIFWVGMDVTDPVIPHSVLHSLVQNVNSSWKPFSSPLGGLSISLDPFSWSTLGALAMLPLGAGIRLCSSSYPRPRCVLIKGQALSGSKLESFSMHNKWDMNV